MTTPFHEADLLFGIFLPMICEQHAEQLAFFRGRVAFNMVGQTPARSWILEGGAGPWITPGQDAAPADLTITIQDSLVTDVIRGSDVNVEEAIQNGGIQFDGDPQLLESLDFIFGETMKGGDWLLKKQPEN